MRRVIGCFLVWVAAVLCGCSGEPSSPPVADGASMQTGEQLYQANCIACHQADAHGIPGVYPSLSGSAVVLGDPAVLARWVILGRRPESMPVGRYVAAMPKFGWLKPPQAAALFTHLRSSFGNAAPAVDAATVARAVDAP